MRRIRTYFSFLARVKKHRALLFERHRLKVDWIGRMYTVLTLTDRERAGGSETGFAKTKVKAFTEEVTETFMQMGIVDIVETDVSALDEFGAKIEPPGFGVVTDEAQLAPFKIRVSSYLVVFSYALLDVPGLLRKLAVAVLAVAAAAIVCGLTILLT